MPSLLRCGGRRNTMARTAVLRACSATISRRSTAAAFRFLANGLASPRRYGRRRAPSTGALTTPISALAPSTLACSGFTQPYANPHGLSYLAATARSGVFLTSATLQPFALFCSACTRTRPPPSTVFPRRCSSSCPMLCVAPFTLRPWPSPPQTRTALAPSRRTGRACRSNSSTKRSRRRASPRSATSAFPRSC